MSRARRSVGIVAVAAVLVLGVCCWSTSARDPDPERKAYVLDSLRRAERGDAPPPSPERAAALYAARGERQAFQIVIYGGEAGLSELAVSLAGPLVSADGSALPQDSVALFREHYVTIPTASYLGLGGARAGVYPDALIPFRNHFTGEPLAAAALESKPFKNETVYIEVAIPENAPAGVYKSAVSILSSGRSFAEIPLTVTVWDFSLPQKPSHRSAFQGYDSEHLLGPARYYGYRQGTPQQRALSVAMDEILLENRVMPEAPVDSYFNVDARGHIVQSAEASQRLAGIFSRPERSDINLLLTHHEPFADPLGADRGKAITYLREAYSWFGQRGLLDKVWLRTHDEPHRDEEFRDTLAFANLIHEANPNWRVAITGGFDHAGFEQYLFGRLNIFMMCFATYDPAKAAELTSRGAEFWSYTAVVQTITNPSPYWQIDFPLLNYRIAPWIDFRYSLAGLLYWTTDHWEEIRARGHSPWEDACSLPVHGTCYNGDGLLVYPGKEVGYVVPEGAYGSLSGAPVWGPIPSLRLKALRDGMQDHELLALAARKNAAATMDAAVSVACNGDARTNCFHSWNASPEALLQMRLRLADIILN
jgi:hypothetical protein